MWTGGKESTNTREVRRKGGVLNSPHSTERENLARGFQTRQRLLRAGGAVYHSCYSCSNGVKGRKGEGGGHDGTSLFWQHGGGRSVAFTARETLNVNLGLLTWRRKLHFDFTVWLVSSVKSVNRKGRIQCFYFCFVFFLACLHYLESV